MPALTISAVDHTTGNLTVTAHGQATGNGPAALFAGFGGVIPTGLAPVTDYWLFVVDANTVRLADSSAHALAGTTLTFATNGTLPLSLGIGIPYRRARSYAALAQVKSADLDALQDADTALWNFLTGQAQSTFSGIVLAANQDVNLSGTGKYKRGTRVRHMHGSAGVLISAPAAATAYYSSSTGSFVFANVANDVRFPLLLEEGEQLVSVRGYVACPATDVLVMKVFRSPTLTVGVVPSAETQLGTTQTSAGHSSQLEQLAVTGLSDSLGAAIGSYSVQFRCSAFGSGGTIVAVDYTTTIP